MKTLWGCEGPSSLVPQAKNPPAHIPDRAPLCRVPLLNGEENISVRLIPKCFCVWVVGWGVMFHFWVSFADLWVTLINRRELMSIRLYHSESTLVRDDW